MQYRKSFLSLFVCALIFLSLCGCGRNDAPQSAEQAALAAAVYADLADVNTQAILAALESAGYTAVDEQGELSFVNADKLEAFVAAKNNGSHESGGYIRVCADGGLIYTVFYYADVWRCRSVRVSCADESAEVTFSSDYALTELRISDKGYLIYTCDIPNNTAPSKHDGYIVPSTMLRLEKRPAELAQYDKYVVPIGYNANDLFTRSWTSAQLSALHLNDAYLSLWRAQHGAYLYYFDNPYPAVDSTALSLVPKAEFEALIEKYLALAPESIAAAAVYDGEHAAYPIEVNAAHKSDSIPIPEVVAVAHNADGTVTLTVDALFVEGATDRAFTHIVTLKPDADGAMRIAANERIYAQGDIEPYYSSYFNPGE